MTASNKAHRRRLLLRVALSAVAVVAVPIATGMIGTAVIKRNKDLGLRLFKPYIAATRAMAGKRFSPLVLLEHQGRRSGKTYTTPLASFHFGDGYLLPLPYGPTTDWCRNVLAAKSAVLHRNGKRLLLENPEVIALDHAVLQQLPSIPRYMTRREADHGLWLHTPASASQ